MSRFSFVCLVALVVALPAFAAEPGRHLSGDYFMTVDGENVDVVSVPMPETCGGGIENRLERQPYSYASFTATEAVEVCVRSGFLDLSKTKILPESKGGMGVSLSAHDETHPIEGVRFENVTGYGPVTKVGKVDFIR